MFDLSTPKNTISILKRHGFTNRKAYGQNFLVDKHILDKILTAAEIEKTDHVLEIGPGIGTLTGHLAERAGTVVAVEIDKRLIPILHETLAGHDNVSIIQADILKIPVTEQIFNAGPPESSDSPFRGSRIETLRDDEESSPIKVVANLPYYITSPIIMALLEGDVRFGSITLMLQKEVAQRMLAGPGTKDYGAFSLAVQYHAAVEIIATVPPSCFIPKPAVESAIVRLRPHPAPPVDVADEAFFFGLIRAAFGQRRKTLANALMGAKDLGLKRENIIRALHTMELAESIRGEALTLAQFATLSWLLSA